MTSESAPRAGGRYGIVITGVGAAAGAGVDTVVKRAARASRGASAALAQAAADAKAAMPARRGPRAEAAARDRVAGRDRSGNYVPPETEGAFQTRLIKAAKLHGWMAVHYRKTRRSGGRGQHGYSTPVEGDAGGPDLLLAKAGRLPILAELKSDREYLKANQKPWRDAIDPRVYRLWRPRDWEAIMAELAG